MHTQAEGVAGNANSAMIGNVTDLIEHLSAAIVGMPVSHVWRGHGSALFLEFGRLSALLGKDGGPRLRRDGSPHHPRGEITLMIEWSWRIEDEHSIICGSWSDDELWQPSLDRLVGQVVAGLTTFGRLPEVAVALSGGLYVASFMTAEGDPEWALIDRREQPPVAVHCRSGAVVSENCATGSAISAGA